MHNWYTHEEIKFKLLMRRHMEDHVIWMRSYMVSLLDNLPDLNKVQERFLKNQEAMINCLREFFGDTLIDNLITVRQDHANMILDLLKAIKDGDNTKALIAEADLIATIENISNMLSIANPCYSKEELIDLHNTSLILSKYEFIARMNGDYNADIMYFDMLIHHAAVMADYITRGINERFFKEEMNYQLTQEDQIYQLSNEDLEMV